MDEIQKAVDNLESENLIEGEPGPEANRTAEGLVEEHKKRINMRAAAAKGPAGEHEKRVDRLEDAALDWGDGRGVDVDFEEEPLYLTFLLDGGCQSLDWHWDFDDENLWATLDDTLEEMRPAGDRCLPGVHTLRDLEDALLEINTSGIFTVDLYRTNAREFRVQLTDEVTDDVEQLTLTWTTETVAAELLRDLIEPIEARIRGIKAQGLSDSELDRLEKLSPEAQKRAETSFYVTDRLHCPVPLSSIIADARQGRASSHWKLRNFIKDLDSTPEPTLDPSLN